ncbi:hypothetical protein [Pseudomonas kitaguniensis]|uniref:hypothetical protein n=1 Tax=Pseudomonas kitaguniensis TaxID=2607908 RepID=UPI003D048404
MTVPALGFTLQDSALPIPNLNTSLLTGNYAEATCSFPLLPMDFVNINMISDVLGGDHNQSFSNALSAPSLIALIPRERVEANTGNSVRLRVSIRRSGVSLTAPDATVTINRRPIVTPNPTTVWDFSDGTFQGWVPQGQYVGGLLRVVNENVVVDLLDSEPGRSHIITRAIPVIAGRTYDCLLAARSDLPTPDGSILYMTINGVKFSRSAPIPTPDVKAVLIADFVAPLTGDAHLGILNDAVPRGIHKLFLEEIRLQLRP